MYTIESMKYQWYGIRCVTSSQLEAVTDFLISQLCPRGCKLQVKLKWVYHHCIIAFMQYTCDVLLPEAFLKVVMSLFEVTREEVC